MGRAARRGSCEGRGRPPDPGPPRQRAGRPHAVAADARTCSELAEALDVLHAADVVQGALNPHTIWINDRERAPSAPWVTLRGFGTNPLMSRRAALDRVEPPPADLDDVAPEQIRREEPTGRVDQYALACMVVHCLTGAPPFERATVNARRRTWTRRRMRRRAPCTTT